MALNIHDAVNESICINTVLLIISIGKILTYFFLLLGSEKSCNGELTAWFLFMFFHDVINYSILFRL
jgi:hypothetical protein